LPSGSLIGFGAAILLFAAFGAGLLITSRPTTTGATARNVGIGLKIDTLANGVRMNEVLSTLGPPDATKTVGAYTQWIYGESRIVESRTRKISILPWLALGDKHEVRQEGTNHFLFFEGETLVGRSPRAWESRVIYRRMNPPQPYPPYPLPNGSDLHTALGAIVDRRTTLEELDGLLGKPWRVLRKDKLQVPYYRIAVSPGGWIYIYVFVKDGVVIWHNYSVSETEADEADRDPFYEFGSWPDYPRLAEDLRQGNP
jgi:hypothetical protein